MSFYIDYLNDPSYIPVIDRIQTVLFNLFPAETEVSKDDIALALSVESPEHFFSDVSISPLKFYIIKGCQSYYEESLK